MKIGIPRAGLYYLYLPFWKKFFEELGFEVVSSPKSDKSIIDLGLKKANSEACFPIKIFYGHINWLMENGIDTILLPQMDKVSNLDKKLGDKSFFCTYFVAMPDMMKAEYPEINVLRPKMIFDGSVIDPQPWLELAEQLGKKSEGQKAYDEAWKEQEQFISRMRSEQLMAMEIIDDVKINSKSQKKLAIIGHPYIVYDLQANLNLPEKIIRHGYSIKTMEMITEEEKYKFVDSQDWQPHNHWVITNEERLALMAVANDKSITGIIYLTPFNCGPDFMMETYVLKSVRKLKPITTISIDEASGEAGLNTRIEAFIDVLN